VTFENIAEPVEGTDMKKNFVQQVQSYLHGISSFSKGQFEFINPGDMLDKRSRYAVHSLNGKSGRRCINLQKTSKKSFEQ